MTRATPYPQAHSLEGMISARVSPVPTKICPNCGNPTAGYPLGSGSKYCYSCHARRERLWGAGRRRRDEDKPEGPLVDALILEKRQMAKEAEEDKRNGVLYRRKDGGVIYG